MLGHDPDPTVTIARVGFGEGFERVQGVGGHLDERGKQRQWGLTKGHGDKGVLLVSEKERREGSNWSERRTSSLTRGKRRQERSGNYERL